MSNSFSEVAARRASAEITEANRQTDVHAVEWLHDFIVGRDCYISPLGRRWLISALGHLSDNLDAYLRSGAK